MTRTTKTALALCVVLLGAAIEARAECKYVRGGITETCIPSNDPLGRLLGTVTGVLNGASTVFITSLNPVRSYDVFVTTSGDMLIAIGAPTRTPVPGEAGEFITHVDLTVILGVGQVRRGDRSDDIRRSVSHWHCPANRRADLQGDRLRSECQRRRQLNFRQDAVFRPVGVPGVSSSAIRDERNRAGRVRGLGLGARGDRGRRRIRSSAKPLESTAVAVEFSEGSTETRGLPWAGRYNARRRNARMA
jgi:hypothetical protein